MVEIAQILNNSKVKPRALTAILRIFHLGIQLETAMPTVILSTSCLFYKPQVQCNLKISGSNSFAETRCAQSLASH